MFCGAQFSLYPLTDRFVEVILHAIELIKDRDAVRVSHDDLSTCVIGTPQAVFDAVRDCFVAACKTAQGHVVLNALFSRGCPGEPDETLCVPQGPLRHGAQLLDPSEATNMGVELAGQFSLYPLGSGSYMETINSEIEALKGQSIVRTPKHFCTRLDGDVGPVFVTLYNCFERAARATGHIVIHTTLSAGSPSGRGEQDATNQ